MARWGGACHHRPKGPRWGGGGDSAASIVLLKKAVGLSVGLVGLPDLPSTCYGVLYAEMHTYGCTAQRLHTVEGAFCHGSLYVLSRLQTMAERHAGLEGETGSTLLKV